ncbi:MAG: tetratricopeptide repeat protein, partial [Candidatus Obscuribacterales bacterium]|nr:tetratricopeptide repeat protein [Candidatus Obscuribacterales bacterium]
DQYDDSPAVSFVFHELKGDICSRLSLGDDALKSYSKALQICMDADGNYTLEAAQSFLGMADVQFYQGKYELAEANAKKALEIRKQFASGSAKLKTLDIPESIDNRKGDQRLAESYILLGRIFQKRRDFLQSLKMYELASAELRKSFGAGAIAKLVTRRADLLSIMQSRMAAKRLLEAYEGELSDSADPELAKRNLSAFLTLAKYCEKESYIELALRTYKDALALTEPLKLKSPDLRNFMKERLLVLQAEKKK